MIINPAVRACFFLAIGLFLCFATWSLRLVLLFDDVSFYQENGILENTQVLLLIVIFFVFFIPSTYQKRKDKLFLIFFALLSFNFILREIDVEEFDIPSFFILFGSGIGRKIMLAVGFISIIFYALFNVKYYVKLSISLLRSRAGFLLAMTSVFLFAGGLFEEQQFQHNEFFEELSELIGYVLFLLVSFLFLDKELKENGWDLR